MSGRKHSCRVLTINGRRCTMEANRLRLDEAENVGAPTSLHRQRQSPDRFTRYMDLMSKCIVTKPSSFEEAVQQPIWVDAMVEEYDSIVNKSAWDIVPRPVRKSVVRSRRIYKVKKAITMGIKYEKAFAPVARYSSIRYFLALSSQMEW